MNQKVSIVISTTAQAAAAALRVFSKSATA
jgi:hypothetical protein